MSGKYRYHQIWQKSGWPAFRWDDARLAAKLGQVRFLQGSFVGKMRGLGFELQNEAVLRTITEDVVTSSDIEGENLDPDLVRSSVALRMGLEIGGVHTEDRNVDGVVEMTMDATRDYNAPLDDKRLWGWHAALFPTGYSGTNKILVAQWRDDADGSMRVISGHAGREKVHYTAPPANQVDQEMRDFLKWFEDDQEIDPVIKAGIAHLWFVSIHPFADGNGRIARAIADMALSRSEGSNQRFYSLSKQFKKEKKAYYDMLEDTQKGDLNVTNWLNWFLDCLLHAIDTAEDDLATILAKARFFERHQWTWLPRQLKVINLMLSGNFKGKLTSTKYSKLIGMSQDVATSDIKKLIEKGVFEKQGASSGTHYTLILPE